MAHSPMQRQMQFHNSNKVNLFVKNGVGGINFAFQCRQQAHISGSV
jgi:hypothetical protein